MKVACLLITHLRAKVEMRRHPNLKNIDAIIVERSRGRITGGRLHAFRQWRIPRQYLRGSPLHPTHRSRPRSRRASLPQGVRSSFIACLQGISDRVEGAELGTAYIRLDGLERMYGGEARMVNALLNAVPQDLAPRVGVAEAKFPAFVAATSERAVEGHSECLCAVAAFLSTPLLSTCSPCTRGPESCSSIGLACTLWENVASITEAAL